MGQAKRRKALDPDYGKERTLIQSFIELGFLPPYFWVGAFAMMRYKRAVVMSETAVHGFTVTGLDDMSDLPDCLKPEELLFVMQMDYQQERALLLVDPGGLWHRVMGVSVEEIKKSLEWAEPKGFVNLTY